MAVAMTAGFFPLELPHLKHCLDFSRARLRVLPDLGFSRKKL